MASVRGWQIGMALIVALVSNLLFPAGQTQAADPVAASHEESIKIKPYTGKPIFLDEPEKVVVSPTMTRRETIKEKLGDGRVEREVAHYSDNTFAADGSYKEFYPNDKAFIEGQFSKGRQEGEWKYYFDNGELNRTVTFKDGKPNGNWEIHRADGTLEAKRGFKDGVRDGEWITYDQTGKLPLSEEHYASGT